MQSSRRLPPVTRSTHTPLEETLNSCSGGRWTVRRRKLSECLPPTSSIICDSSRSLVILIKPAHKYCGTGRSLVRRSLFWCLCINVNHKSNLSIVSEWTLIHTKYAHYRVVLNGYASPPVCESRTVDLSSWITWVFPSWNNRKQFHCIAEVRKWHRPDFI